MHAQRLLKRGLQLKHIAFDVGYGSALTQAFVRKLGCYPAAWRNAQQKVGRSSQTEMTGHSNETLGAQLKAHTD
ncbi:MAG: hypothetical protein ACOH2B_08700 [Burkholderiaceae bacterium]